MVCALQPASSAACTRNQRPRRAVGRDRKHSLSCIVAASLGHTFAAATSSNLGVLQSLAEPDKAASDVAAALAQQPAAFSGGGIINVDGTAIASSLLVLLLLLALSTNRILGLERFLGQWLKGLAEQRRYERRNELLAARQSLEQQFSADDGQEEDEGKSRS